MTALPQPSRARRPQPSSAAMAGALGFALLALPVAAQVQTPSAPSAAPSVQPVVPAPEVLNYLAHSTATQRMATSYLGQNVYGADGERIGDVNDIVVDLQPGGVPVIVIGVGGFLGIGEKNVAVPLGALHSKRLDGAQRLVIGATRDDLRKAPAFVRGRQDP